jgi:hypothetical protein
MSQPLTFMKKLQLFRLYLKVQQNGVVVDCAFCKSTNISFDNQETNEPKNYPDYIIYFSDYTCNNCGAKCENKQIWKVQ